MSDPVHSFHQPHLTFAKLTATPTDSSWAQVYHAGRLFAALSLTRVEETEEERSLSAIGKDFLSSLEDEFFTLEEKNLAGIKSALTTALAQVPSTIKASLAAGSITNDILYVYASHGAKIQLKRGEEIGTVLRAEENDDLLSASGEINDHDLLLLQTKALSELLSSQDLTQAPTPSELIEALTPKIHEKETGAEAGLAVLCTDIVKTTASSEEQAEDTPSDEEEILEEPEEEKKSSVKLPSLHVSLPSFSVPNLFTKKKQLLFVAVILLLLIVFGIGITTTKQKQESAKNEALFQQYYPSAQKMYEDGQALMDLNKNIARDDLEKAKATLEKASASLPPTSPQGKQVAALLQRINAALASVGGTQEATASAVDTTASPLLAALTKNSNGLFATSDDKGTYLLTQDGVSETKADGSVDSQLFKNDSDWSSPAGFGTFGGNFYILDKKSNAISKFVPSSYQASTYLAAGTEVDFSKVVSLAIDSSIYVLSSDGSVAKFTRGTADTFSLSKLPNPLVKPTRIFTGADFDNIYILDPGQNSVVVVDKNGVYQTQYKTAIIKNAKDLDVHESDKKLFILSGGKVYEITMQ